MVNLADILFALSSEERIQILTQLTKEEAKLTQISKKLDITATEASRHLQRLGDLNKITRNSKGAYTLTSLGTLMVNMIPTLTFISKNGDYFLTHSPKNIPYKLVNRLGELFSSKFSPSQATNIHHSAQMIGEAEEYVWAMTYQYPVLTTPAIKQRVEDGLQIRFILPAGIQAPEGIDINVFGRCEIRSIPEVQARVILTDKEAQFGLSTSDGGSDYAAFVSGDDKFREWAKDLFNHYWSSGKPTIL